MLLDPVDLLGNRCRKKANDIRYNESIFDHGDAGLYEFRFECYGIRLKLSNVIETTLTYPILYQKRLVRLTGQ